VILAYGEFAKALYFLGAAGALFRDVALIAPFFWR
jgi:hypothetical protein